MNTKSPKVKREAGKTVPLKDVKHQVRLYLTLTMTCDILPVWWKYYAKASQATSNQDRPSYAIKWLIIQVNLEVMRMKRRQ